MSSGLFHTDWYTDPPWDSVTLSWLINYAQNIRTNPALTQALNAEKEQFEMVPMPKEVIQHLAASRRVSTSVGMINQAASIQHTEQVNNVIRSFSQALESGKLEGIASLLSPNYKDASGRDAAHLQADLRKLVGSFSNLRIVPFSTDNLIVLGNRLVANIQVAWEATTKAHAGAAPVQKSASSTVELILEKNPAGAWAIAGIRVL